jgi:hypothetical protein
MVHMFGRGVIRGCTAPKHSTCPKGTQQTAGKRSRLKLRAPNGIHADIRAGELQDRARPRLPVPILSISNTLKQAV